FGYKYGYALEALCAHLGKTHHPAAWSAINFRAFDAIKQVVPPMPSGENIEGILHRGSLVSMPQPDDFPSMGYLKLAEIETLRPLVQQAIVACDGNKEKEWEQEALAELQSWLDQATDAGDDLIEDQQRLAFFGYFGGETRVDRIAELGRDVKDGFAFQYFVAGRIVGILFFDELAFVDADLIRPRMNTIARVERAHRGDTGRVSQSVGVLSMLTNEDHHGFGDWLILIKDLDVERNEARRGRSSAADKQRNDRQQGECKG
ncbi:unnamed protein product, partial [Symbiodinium sp. CCMP2456]